MMCCEWTAQLHFSLSLSPHSLTHSNLLAASALIKYAAAAARDCVRLVGAELASLGGHFCE
jgi:hypothetical protein